MTPLQVLIVDERPAARMVLRRVLERLDMALLLHEFGDADSALAFTAHTPPDCVLIDYSRPGLDGLAFAQRFRLRACHRDVPIVLLVAQESTELRDAALRAGIHDVVLKPVVPRLLHRRCQTVLARRREALLVSEQHTSLEDRLAWALRNLDERERELNLRGY